MQCVVMTVADAVPGRFALFDDGNTDSLWGPAFATPTSRDVTPGNGVFTRGINARLLSGGVPASYMLQFTALRGGVSVAYADVNVTVQDAAPCILSSVPAQTAFATCFAPQKISTSTSRIRRATSSTACG